MDPLLKEFLVFFGVWPLVILLTIVVGMRIGKLMSRGVNQAQLKTATVKSADIARRRL